MAQDEAVDLDTSKIRDWRSIVTLIVFVVTIFFQNWRQDSIDDEFGLGEE